MSVRRVVVVGGGLAAAKAVEELRARGHEGEVVLISAETHLPYERPPLSKGFLAGTEPLESVFVHTEAWYADHDVELRLGTRVTDLAPGRHTLSAGGEEIPFDKLLLATGATPRRLPSADRSGAPVAYLRTIADSERLQKVLAAQGSLVILGAGWIGLEVAAAARLAGCSVTVVESAPHPLLRVLGPEVAEGFTALHRRHGVDVRTGVAGSTITGDPRHVALQLPDGSAVEADLLLVGIGAVPETSLAEAAGLAVDNGVLVYDTLLTNHPDVLAAGDVANADHPTLGRRIRVEHWDNAIQQGRTAARNILGGGEKYDRLPYFFTDQYDLGMEYVGALGPEGYEEVVVRGDASGTVDGASYTALWLERGAVIAGAQVNDWDATAEIRRLVDASSVDLEAVRDPGVPLRDVSSG